MNEESVCSRPHPNVHMTTGGNTGTTFPLLRVDSKDKGEVEKKEGKRGSNKSSECDQLCIYVGVNV
jgi:hypothetical protein